MILCIKKKMKTIQILKNNLKKYVCLPYLNLVKTLIFFYLASEVYVFSTGSLTMFTVDSLC